jgi:hypothetical protein
MSTEPGGRFWTSVIFVAGAGVWFLQESWEECIGGTWRSDIVVDDGRFI